MNAITTYLAAIVAVIQREPVRTVAVIRSGIMLLLAFWPGLLSPDQTTAILAFIVVWFGVDEAVRSQVTPVAK